jgi:hypothetical protein
LHVNTFILKDGKSINGTLRIHNVWPFLHHGLNGCQRMLPDR